MHQPSFSETYQLINAKTESVMMNRLHFVELPAYSQYLLSSRISELVEEQQRLSTALKLPLLSHFSHLSESELKARGKESLIQMLEAISANSAADYIEEQITVWINNKIPDLSSNQVTAEDISLIGFIRSKMFRDSLTFYTHDLNMGIRIMEELDAFNMTLESLFTRKLLNLQEELHDQAQKIAHIGSWTLDLTTNQINWSNELFRIYELEPQNPIPYNLASFNHPEDTEYIKAQIDHSRLTGEPHDFYYRIRTKDGIEKFLHARGQVVRDASGVAEKMYGTLQDVTVQKKMEREHSEYEYFIQRVTALTPSIISVYNVNTGRYLFINQAIQTILGYSPDRVLEKGIDFFKEIIHPEDLDRLLSENNQAIEQHNNNIDVSGIDEIREFKYRIRHANGGYRWFHTFGAVFERNSLQRVEKVINVSMDISEQMDFDLKLKSTAEEILWQENRYYRMIDEVEDYAILLLSPEGIVENWNSGAEKIKGYKSDEIVGKNFRIFYTPEDLANKVPDMLIQEAMRVGKASHEGWRVRKDGSRFWGSILITALHNNRNEVIGFSKVTRDLTQKKLAEDNLRMYAESLEQKNAELKQKNLELESFGYIASHDLQEPVRKIQIWANRLEETEQISEYQKDTMHRIQKACIQMQNLIRGILQYSQTDQQYLPREPTDLNQVLDEVIEGFSDSIEENNITILREPLPVVKVIRIQFLQLFSNMISNAIRFRREDVPLKIKIECRLLSEAIEAGGLGLYFYQITITDNGIGFMQEYADKMFELFRRLESGPRYPGTGIGLAICKKIVINHGGSIRACGVPGEGASFEIHLPAEN